jgi:hypothetical protein
MPFLAFNIRNTHKHIAKNAHLEPVLDAQVRGKLMCYYDKNTLSHTTIQYNNKTTNKTTRDYDKITRHYHSNIT